MPPTLLLGPILGYEAPGRYSVCCVVGPDLDPSDMQLEASAGLASVASWTPLPSGRRFLRFTLDGVAGGAGGPVAYRILMSGTELASKSEGGSSWTFHPPVPGEEVRFAFASCNGFSSRPGRAELAGATPAGGSRWGQWDELQADHEDEPIHLLVLGGDQIYSDAIFKDESVAPAFCDWLGLSLRRRMKRGFTRVMRDQLERSFEGFYLKQWGYPAVASVMARIPSVMMWDDHDIIDGWGSYEKVGDSEVMRGLFEVADRLFQTFQLRLRGENASILAPGGTHHSWWVQIGSHLVLGLDNRSRRTTTRIMDEAQWGDVDTWLQAHVESGLPAGVENLHIVSPVPVAYRHFGKADLAFRSSEWFRREDDPTSLEDDVRDHWQHRKHEWERVKLIKTLIDAIRSSRGSARGVRRATILSGDVHVACAGSIRSSDGIELHQVVSSGILHPPPSFAEWLGVRATSSDNDQDLEGGTVRVRTERIVGQDAKFVRRRNYAVAQVRGGTPKLYVMWKFESTVEGASEVGTLVAGDMRHEP